ncbi:hypothetical protein H4W23_40340 [Streptomyces gardneri]|uniref:hypothetical protein n=1 Tax=Streptomyces gardneri TaxID=66892 RepID=UPI0006BDEBD1|nr:hypothetical protein [Streptomyces gardneri]QPK50211.1 hypothetical protein H4W23_40340 [Streptomyces gardneri]WRK41818.1 hypothetical protein U0M97_40595 [Streptomyces venezuelae]CUM35598.1 hypothetical protein BN2537_161 [Streptomyces venezuelae]
MPNLNEERAAIDAQVAKNKALARRKGIADAEAKTSFLMAVPGAMGEAPPFRPVAA